MATPSDGSGFYCAITMQTRSRELQGERLRPLEAHRVSGRPVLGRSHLPPVVCARVGPRTSVADVHPSYGRDTRGIRHNAPNSVTLDSMHAERIGEGQRRS